MGVPHRLRSVLRYSLYGIATLLLVTLLLTGLVYYVAVSDQERVPQWVEGFSREQLGVEASFSHYRFQYFEHFPFLSLVLEDVVVEDESFPGTHQEILRIKAIDVVFRPWKLLESEYELRSVHIDTARLLLYRNADGVMNAGALAKDTAAVSLDSNMVQGLFDIDRFTIHGLYVDYLDSLYRKHHRLEMQQARLGFHQSDSARHLKIEGDWLFHHLTFKMKNGPFFAQQSAAVDLALAFPHQEQALIIQPSTVTLPNDTIHLEGKYQTPAPGYLKLDIGVSNLLLADAKPLLANNLQEVLAPYQIDRPLAVEVHIAGETPPGSRQPLTVDIKGDDLKLETSRLSFTETQLRAHFRNDCDSSGIITPYTNCLEVRMASAKLFDTIQLSNLTYFHENLKQPKAAFEGMAEVPLPHINGLLPDPQLQFTDGWVSMDFAFEGVANDLIDPNVRRLQAKMRASGQIKEAAGSYGPLAFKRSSLDFRLDSRRLSLDQATLVLNEQPLKVKGVLKNLPAVLFDKRGELEAALQVAAGELDLASFLESQKGSFTYPKAFPFRRLALQLRAEKLAYRQLRLYEAVLDAELRGNCSTADTCLWLHRISGKAFKTIPIEGKAALIGVSNPAVALQLQVTTPIASLQPLVPDGLLRLRSGAMDLSLYYRGELQDYASFDQAALSATLEGKASLQGADADFLPKGYRFRDINTQLRFDEKDLFIDSLSGALNGNRAFAKGELIGLLPFIFGDRRQDLVAQLQLKGNSIDLNTLTNEPMPGANPKPKPEGSVGKVLDQLLERLHGAISVDTDTLRYRSMELTGVSLESKVRPGCEGQVEEGGCVQVSDLHAKLFGSTPLKASLSVANLRDPFLVADVQVDMPVQELNRMFAPGQFQFGQGRVELGFHYEGQPHKHFDVEEALLKAKLSGQGQLLNAAFVFQPRGYEFEQVNAAFRFDGQDLQFDTLDVYLNDNHLLGSGEIRDFLPFLFLPERALDASLRVYARRFDLNQFKAPEKFQSRKPGKPERPTAITRLVNAGLSNIETDFNVRFDTVLYRNFLSTSVNGEIMLGKGRLAFNRTQMSLAGGQFALNGEIAGLRNNRPDLNLEAQLRQTDVQAFFRAFDNFGQSALTAENLEGVLTGNLAFRGRANANYELDPASMEGRFELKVEDGSLINLPALDSIRSILFRNRDLSHIEFATLENTFYLDGQDLQIGHFEVPSSVLTFSVDGRYSLADDQRTNLLFEIPMANLFRKDLSRAALEQVEAEDKSGPNILIRAKGGEEGLRFRWVLSRKE